MTTELITDVADTAFWVAHYRAAETERPDALFRDPLAGLLAGERGRKIAMEMKRSRYTRWSVVIRTHIIDRYILERIAAGVDTILNLGAGLDTRPYRLDLPASLHWIEVDHPKIVEFKDQQLEGSTPNCNLERIPLDLAEREARLRLFSRVNAKAHQVLVLTEGVIPYLTPDQVTSLADDLLAQPRFSFWVVEYYAEAIYRYLRSARGKSSQMKNAPFQFFPRDWLGLFSAHGWHVSETRYLAEESQKLGRAIPLPWWATVLRVLMPRQKREESNRFNGYILLRR